MPLCRDDSWLDRRNVDTDDYDWRSRILILQGIASWRVVAGCFVGMIAFSLLLNGIGSGSNPAFAMPWHWHMVVGGFAFGAFFMATDPVSSAMTDPGALGLRHFDRRHVCLDSRREPRVSQRA